MIKWTPKQEQQYTRVQAYCKHMLKETTVCLSLQKTAIHSISKNVLETEGCNKGIATLSIISYKRKPTQFQKLS